MREATDTWGSSMVGNNWIGSDAIELMPKSATSATAAATDGQCFVLSSVMFIVLRPPQGRGLSVTALARASSVRSHYSVRCGGAGKRCLITNGYKALFAASGDVLAENQCANVLDGWGAIGKRLVVVAAQREFIGPGFLDGFAHLDVLLVADEIG